MKLLLNMHTNAWYTRACTFISSKSLIQKNLKTLTKQSSKSRFFRVLFPGRYRYSCGLWGQAGAHFFGLFPRLHHWPEQNENLHMYLQPAPFLWAQAGGGGPSFFFGYPLPAVYVVLSRELGMPNSRDMRGSDVAGSDWLRIIQIWKKE